MKAFRNSKAVFSKKLDVGPIEKKDLKSISKLEDRRIEHMHQMLDDAEAEIVDEAITPGRFFFMRPSGFPYCGLRKLLSAPKILSEGQTTSLAGGYFTSVGTAAHTVFQSHIGRLGEVVGDWKCPSCGKFTKFTTFKVCDCGHKPQYEELEVKYKDMLVGHLDGLVKLKERDPKTGKRKYIVIDYKTATARAVAEGQKPNQTMFPYAYNVQQIKRYVILMELCFGIHVEGWMLIYLNRDVPLGRKNRAIISVTMSDEEKAGLVRELKSWIKTHRRVLTAQTYDDFEWIRDRKLCASHKDYDTNWASPYQPCPVLPQCFDQKKLEKRIQKQLGNNVYPLINMAPTYLLEQMKMSKIELKKE